MFSYREHDICSVRCLHRRDVTLPTRPGPHEQNETSTSGHETPKLSVKITAIIRTRRRIRAIRDVVFVCWNPTRPQRGHLSLLRILSYGFYSNRVRRESGVTTLPEDLGLATRLHLSLGHVMAHPAWVAGTRARVRNGLEPKPGQKPGLQKSP